MVVVGRGPTLGRPLALLLSLKEPGANAAVTVVHTGVKDWAEYTRRADIVVGAAGVPNMITPDVIAVGACVIGGGLTWEGKRVISDVDERCAEVAGWVTPRLGGVGVTTVAMLLRNTVTAAEVSVGLRQPSLTVVMTKVSELLAAGRTYSFEFFPPKNDAEQARLVQTAPRPAAFAALLCLGDLPGRAVVPPADDRSRRVDAAPDDAQPDGPLDLHRPHPTGAGRHPRQLQEVRGREPDGAGRRPSH